MKWLFQLHRPYKAAVILSLLMAAVILFNLVNRRHITAMNKSVKSIYADRLVPVSALFHVNNLLHQKRLLMEAWLSGKTNAIPANEIASIDRSAGKLINSYEKTYLVKEEKTRLQQLKKELANYALYEQAVLKLHPSSPGDAALHYQNKAIPAWQNSVVYLAGLADLQARVGSDLLKDSGAIHSFSGILSGLEMVLAIVLGVIVISLAAQSKLANTRQNNYRMN